MAKKNGAQSVETIPGRHIVLSAGVGKTNIDELKWLTDTVLSDAKAWKNTGWAYIADCSQMSPVSPTEGGELVTMTKKFVDAGCKAFAFAEGKSVLLKVQAQKNTAFKYRYSRRSLRNSRRSAYMVKTGTSYLILKRACAKIVQALFLSKNTCTNTH